MNLSRSTHDCGTVPRITAERFRLSRVPRAVRALETGDRRQENDPRTPSPIKAPSIPMNSATTVRKGPNVE